MNRLTTSIAMLAITGSLCSTAFAETKWTMVSGYPEDSFFTQNARQFIEEVEAASNGELTIDLRPNGELIKLDAIKRAVQSGQVQIGEIRLGVYGNEDLMYTLDSYPNVAGDYDAAMRLTEAQMPYFDKEFGDNGMRVLSYAPWPGQGFYTDFPVESVDQFKDVKLRIYSPATQQMGELLGFQATILPFAEIPQAFSTGLIDALFTSAQTGTDIQAWDYVSHFTYTGSMHNKNAIIVSERALSQLDEALQAEIISAGERATARAWELSSEAGQATIAELEAAGMTVSEAPAALQEKLSEIGEVMMKQWSSEVSPEAIAVLEAYQASGQ